MNNILLCCQRTPSVAAGILRMLSMLFLLTALTTVPASTTYASGVLKLGGSGCCIAVMQRLADAFRQAHPDVQIKIMPSLGSSGGIKAVLSGSLDIGLSSRPLKEDERRHGAVETPFAVTPFVIAAHANSPVSDITLPWLADIYAGKVNTWPDGKPLRIVLRPKPESDNAVLRSMSDEMDRAVTAALERKGMIIALTDQDNADKIQNIPGALGATTLGQLTAESRQLKLLSINGITPSTQTIADGSYPYYKTFTLVTGATTSPLVQEFIDFVDSNQGREILSKTGHRLAAKKNGF